MAVKDPMKLARKEFPKYGATLIIEGDAFQQWRMPRGDLWNVRPTMRIDAVRRKVAELKVSEDPLKEFVMCDPLEFSDELEGSSHFTERFLLMQEQAHLDEHEVREAWRNPTETRYCYRMDSYALIRDRVAVIVGQDWDNPGGWKLVSVWWARPDLWAKFPRPDKEPR